MAGADVAILDGKVPSSGARQSLGISNDGAMSPGPRTLLPRTGLSP